MWYALAMRRVRDRGRWRWALGLAVLAGALSPGVAATANGVAITRAASDACSIKVKKIQEFETGQGGPRTQTTSFTQTELNSYLAWELSPKYHPSLKKLEIHLQQGKVAGIATLDFDQLGMGARGVLGKAMASLFSGVHRLHARGPVRATGGQAYFVLEEARFDDTRIPNFLVEEVITAVGRKQKPPFDPMKPSRMPYQIDRVDLQPGKMLVHQVRQ
jgi:hypothetical protein